MSNSTTNATEITCADDLADYLDMELWNDVRFISLGILRSAPDRHGRCTFEVPGGKVVSRRVEDVLISLRGSYEFVEPSEAC